MMGISCISRDSHGDAHCTQMPGESRRMETNVAGLMQGSKINVEMKRGFNVVLWVQWRNRIHQQLSFESRTGDSVQQWYW